MKKTEIGSYFWEYSLQNQSKQSAEFWWCDNSYNKKLLKSGRNAIKALCLICSDTNKVVLLPEYTCHTVIEPFLEEGWSVYFYPINKNMTVNEMVLLQKAELLNPDLVLFQSYFGFDTLYTCYSTMSELKKKGCIIAEDFTQSLLSGYHFKEADFYVASLRKFMAIPNGGVLVSECTIPDLNMEKYNEQIEVMAFRAFDMKRMYFEKPDSQKRDYFRKCYYELEKIFDDNNILESICPSSKRILLYADYSFIIARRKENYSFLFHMISESCLKPILNIDTTDCVPLYLPVYVEDRVGFQQFMTANNVYCPIVWPKPTCLTVVTPSVEYMYNHLICLPIDQRYNREDMERIVSLIEQYEKGLI